MRARRGLSMNAVAALAGVPVSTISRIESGKIDPTLSMLDRIAAAIGYTLAPAVTESGSDEPFAAALRELDAADPDDRRGLIVRLPIVAALAPVARRTGAARVDLDRGLHEALVDLRHESQDPVLSSLEAFATDLRAARSFTPVIYVNDPSTVTAVASASASSRQVAMLLPTTDNVRRFTRTIAEGVLVTREWGLLDALASPGRQSDVARPLLDLLIADAVLA